jgi:hypothetical protein
MAFTPGKKGVNPFAKKGTLSAEEKKKADESKKKTKKK